MADLLRHLAAMGIAVLGTAGVCALSLGMNAQVEKRALEPVSVVQEIAVPARPAAQRASRPRRTGAARQAARKGPSAAPLLAAGLEGLDFGFGDAADLALSGVTEALVQDLGASVIDEDAVEVPPRPTRQEPPSFPARARALGLSGFVTLSFVVDVDGSAQDIHVVEAEPPGTFDEAAVMAVEEWTFEPGRQEGAPVAVRVRQTLRFALE
ncbi:MAG: energy transducer TonB [Deltaproteobacteria bacterium]|nr:energy transducer TonB [Deltaproteobacteria bacterium]